MLTLKQARGMAGITQQELADALDIHVQTYRRIEHDPKRATIAQAETIAHFFDDVGQAYLYTCISTLNRLKQ